MVKKDEKKQMTVWLPEKVETALRSFAATQGLKLSEVACSFIESGLSGRAQSAGVDLIAPAVERAVARELSKFAARSSRLMARAALEASTARRLTARVLGESPKYKDKMLEVGERAWRDSVESLRKPGKELASVIGLLESEDTGAELANLVQSRQTLEAQARQAAKEKADLEERLEELEVLTSRQKAEASYAAKMLQEERRQVKLELEALKAELEELRHKKRPIFG